VQVGDTFPAVSAIVNDEPESFAQTEARREITCDEKQVPEKRPIVIGGFADPGYGGFRND